MRKVLMSMLALGLVAGCAESKKHEMHTAEKAKPAPELASLQKLVGNWTGEAQLVEPSPEKMKEMTGQDMSKPTKGGGKWEWTMNGMLMKGDGWHEMGGGEKATYLEYISWDPTIKKFRSYYFSDSGEQGEGVMTVSEDGKVFKSKYTGVGHDGKAMSGHGTMTFVDDKTIEWEFSQRSGWFGPGMKMKGTSKKQ